MLPFTRCPPGKNGKQEGWDEESYQVPRPPCVSDNLSLPKPDEPAEPTDEPTDEPAEPTEPSDPKPNKPAEPSGPKPNEPAEPVVLAPPPAPPGADTVKQ